LSNTIDLKEIEKKILKASHQHGFFDMMIGFIVTGMAFGPIFREFLPEPYNYFLWPLIIVVIAEIIFIIVFKYVILPRAGKARPGSSLKSIRKKLVIITSIQFIIQLSFFIILAIGNGPGIRVEGIMFILIIGLFFIPIMAIIAYLMKYPRLYIIGMLIWLGIFINELLYDPIDYRIRWLLSYGIIGCIIFIIGLKFFIQFLKNYPKPKIEVI
jgi:hypothetical protein